jgi:hypothetical protein
MQLYSVDVASGSRRTIARVTANAVIVGADLAYANGRLFVMTGLGRPSLAGQLLVSAINVATGRMLWEKTHDLAEHREGPRFFVPYGDLISYAIGGQLWILRGDDGALYAEHREGAPIRAVHNRADSAIADPDLVYFYDASNALVGYSLSEKRVVRRISQALRPAPPVPTGAEHVVGGALLAQRPASIARVNTARTPDDSLPVSWEIGLNPRAIVELFRDGDILWLYAQDGLGHTIEKVEWDTGKVLGRYDYPALWDARLWALGDRGRMTIHQGRVYTFTPDGLAYSIELRPAAN